MIQPCDKNAAVPAGIACPSDAVLLELLEDRLPMRDEALAEKSFNS